MVDGIFDWWHHQKLTPPLYTHITHAHVNCHLYSEELRNITFIEKMKQKNLTSRYDRHDATHNL